ncbi:unnamed protein product [Bursaphelenchus xylophilus]|uniref:Tubulin--tyrosine ligase-like protein 9 n=1 Tax=Bursaphelenchus xylophilus TaxID=6326 RepID=A0A1I7RTU1_BURXY|nr:unnamed protein product [Bursaphelenchus xylophilus]CAG9122112.1 unnamed protein product [Bursaphelenchus xylophilus]
MDNRRKRILWKCALTNTIQEVLNARPGWAPTSGEDWQFYWVNREWMVQTFDRHKFKEGQKICHFRNDFELTRKDSLIKNHKKTKKLAKNGEKMDYLPASYVLPLEYHIFVEEFKKYPPDTIWIMKPVSGAQGRGIFLFKKLKEIQEWKKKGSKSDADTQPYVVQSYIHRPYLIGGKKFDVRLYVLTTSFRPLNAWVHREGFSRFSHSRYSLESVEDAYVHLTNVAISKSASDYDPEKGLKWSLDKLFRYMEARHGMEVVDKLIENIGNIIVMSLKSVQGIIIQDSHCFELYGYDILIDEDLKPWLLEVNASPSLTPSSQEDFELKFRVLNHLLDVLDMEKVRTEAEPSIGGFDCLIRNNELVYRPKSEALEKICPQFVTPSLNIRLGSYVAPMSVPPM